MVSYHKFIKLLDELFLDPMNLISVGFDPHWSTDVKNIKVLHNKYGIILNGTCIWWHEEPFNKIDFVNLINYEFESFNPMIINPHCYTILKPLLAGMIEFPNDVNFMIFANSEKSQVKNNLLKESCYQDWYFFFHGFAALHWYQDYKYFKTSNLTLSKVFICLNHVITNKRSYRLTLLAHLFKNNLVDKGHISAPLLNKQLIKKELSDSNSYLSVEAKKHILKNLYPHAHSMILDECADYNLASADIIDDKFVEESMWHIVNETVFYENKLHLTEKIFKPIVLKRPFILVAAPKNLQYLKSYGFKTFDKWIDESYDDIQDSDARLEKISIEINKLCQLSKEQLNDMYLEMQEILEYNFVHFYGQFKEVIVDELIENFQKCIFLNNKDKSDRFRLPQHNLDYVQIKKILMS